MRKLKIARIMRGMTQWDLAARTGIPNYRISLIENGRVEARSEELAKLAETLGTTPKALNQEMTRA